VAGVPMMEQTASALLEAMCPSSSTCVTRFLVPAATIAGEERPARILFFRAQPPLCRRRDPQSRINPAHSAGGLLRRHAALFASGESASRRSDSRDQGGSTARHQVVRGLCLKPTWCLVPPPTGSMHSAIPSIIAARWCVSVEYVHGC